ncbi:hypothetical protein AAG906_022202 [Vitis piasezkii]
MLEQLDANALETPFLEEEVFDALVGCNGDKAPGPDGFSMAFWLFAWDFVKADVMGFFKEFYENGKFVKSLNATFLVLANRLKKVVGKVVSKAQGAFVEGRQILDAVLIANEAIDSTLKNNESGILCKLDIEKAYDKVDWNFILTIMEKMGFGEKWIRWIHGAYPLQGERSKRRRGSNFPLVAVSGLRINLEKSELIPVGRVESMDDLLWRFWCSGSVRRRLEKIQRDFLWGGGNLDHKPHLVRWELVCISKAKGGLGWNWRFANEREALWNKVIRGKYGEARGGWCSREVREAHGLGL